MDAQNVQFFAGLLGLVGGVILAFSLNGVLSEVNFAVTALSTSLESVVGGRDVYIFGGLNDRLKNASRISASWVRAGLYCLIVSTFLSTFSIFQDSLFSMIYKLLNT
jgi:hypothetical protein